MRSRRLKQLSVIVVLAVTASVLSGCDLLLRDPPAVVSSAVEGALEQLSELDGVSSVSSSFSADAKDGGPLSKPAAWRVGITVDLRPDVQGLAALAEDAERVFASVRSVVTTSGVLRIPADSRGAPAMVELNGGEDSTPAATAAAAVTSVRILPGVSDVAVSDGPMPARVGVASAAQWSGLAAALRQLPELGSGPLRAVSLDVRGVSAGASQRMELDATVPSAPLIEALSDLAVRHDVDDFSFGGLQAHAGGSPMYRRPLLRVAVSSPAAVEETAVLLASLGDAQSVVSSRPRAAFIVSTSSEDPASAREGYLGLPLGSAEPDDVVTVVDETAAQDPARAVVLDQAAADARLAADHRAVSTMLSDAGALAGSHGTVEVSTQRCRTDATRQVRGAVLIPIFEMADTAQDAFDAIVASWREQGFTHIEGSAGTALYSPVDDLAEGVQLLTIRGTADGISLSATAACIVAR